MTTYWHRNKARNALPVVLVFEQRQRQPGDSMVEIDRTPVAGNGLLDRRIFLRAGVAGGATLLTAQAAGLEREEWMKFPGYPMSESGAPSAY